MTAAVVDVYTAIRTQTSVTLTVTTPVAAGDVLVALDIGSYNSAAEHQTAIAGLGGTWTKVPFGLTGAFEFWIGTGCTGTGNVTSSGGPALTLTNQRQLRVWHVTGVDPAAEGCFLSASTVAASGDLAAAGTITADNTNLVIAVGVSDAPANNVRNFAPATGWTLSGSQNLPTSGSYAYETAHRAPATTEDHSVDGATASASTGATSGLLVVGAAPLPAHIATAAVSTQFTGTSTLSIGPVVAGDVVVIEDVQNQGGSANHTAMAGLGGTWTRLNGAGGTPNMDTTQWAVWIGTGCSGTGTVTGSGGVTLSGTARRRLRAWVLRGVYNPGTLTGAVASISNSTATTAPRNGGRGQVVIGMGYSDSASTVISALVPTNDGWSTSWNELATTNDRRCGFANRVPTGATESHTVSSSRVSGGTFAGILVVGEEIPAPPNVPTSVVGTPHYTDADLSWAAPSGGSAVTSYEVRIDGGTPVTATSPHNFTGLTPGTVHLLEVRSVGPGGNSGWVSASVTTLGPPGAPTGLAVTATTVSTIAVSWVAPVGGTTVDGYDVRVDGGAATDVGAVLAHTFTGLTPDTAYTLEVRSHGPGGTSAWVGLTSTTEGPPDEPTDLAVTDATITSLTVTWVAPVGGTPVDGYDVRRDGGSPTDAGAVLTYTFTGLTPTTTYTLEVRAYGPGGDSGWVSVDGTTVTPVDTSPGGHVWVYPSVEAWEADDQPTDFTCFADEVSVVHGRGDTESQPEASAATTEFTVRPEDPDVWAVVDIGAVCRVVIITEGPVIHDRFVGRVTDLTLAWDEAGTDTPDRGIGQMVAAGFLADYGRRVVGAVDYPQELDGARADRAADEAGMPLAPLITDPGTVEVLARPANPTGALGVIQQTGESAGGFLWETRDGLVAYADAEHRRGVLVGLSLDACDILVTPAWRRNLSGMVNRVTVSYGTADGHYTAEDVSSLDRWGEYARSFGTELAEAADATAMGNLLLLRNSSPVWVLSAIPVDTPSLSAEDYVTLLGLDVHSLIELTGLPAIGVAPVTMAAWVEGWRERITFEAHDIELVVSDYCRTAPPVRWDEVDPDTTWDTWDADNPGRSLWDEAGCGGYQPLPDLGRWQDVPASLRWDQVPITTTWDTWGT